MGGTGGEAEVGGALVTASYARALLDHLRSRGIDPARLYPAPSVAEIESAQGRTRLPLAQWLAMIHSAQTAVHDPDLPLKIGMEIKPRHVGLLGYVAMSCATMGDAITQLQRYTRLVGDISNTSLIRKGPRVELVWEWAHSGPVPPALPQLQLASRASIARRLTDRADWTTAAHFQFPRPANVGLYDRFFGQPSRFGQSETKLVFKASDLNLPVVTADPEMRHLAAAQAESILKQLAREPEFLRELKSILIRGLAAGRVSLADCAHSLNISPRTLQRRLDEHRYIYRQVLEEVRQTQAERCLQDPRTSLAQVAFMLGYTEQSTFQSAFKRWTGMTPGDFRHAKGRSRAGSD